jgi:ribosomal protein L37E
MYKSKRFITTGNDVKCPECGSKSFSYAYNKLTCKNCDYTIKNTGLNKYNAKRTKAKDGLVRDSKFEAKQADILLLRKQTRDIKDYDTQFKVEMWVYREDGIKAFKVSHKVDFRIHHNDGSYELLEAKGVETSDYRFRRRLLEALWLPLHRDHTYTVVKQ